jgi:hypothetical protein
MTITRATTWCCFCGLALAAATWASGDPRPSAKDAPDAVCPIEQTEQARQVAWADAMSMNDHHAALQPLAGMFRADVTVWNAPGAEPMQATGEAVNELLYDGRFLRRSYTGSIGGMTLEGSGTWGYNNITKQYESTWTDSLSTSIIWATGQPDENHTRFVLRFSITDPYSGEAVQVREVWTIIGANTHVQEMFIELPDGTEWQNLRTVFKRVTSASKAG